MTTLDSFIKSSRPLPKPIHTSQPIKDRNSVFVATIYAASSPVAAYSITKHVKHVVNGSHPATHNMMAYRIMSLKSGHTGLNGPEDFEVNAKFEDDGEKYGGARILKIMQAEGVIDAVVIVSRWYGGTLLGPVRFTHIESCSREVCVRFKGAEELERCVERLKSLDGTLAHLRSQLGNGEIPATSKLPDYSTLIAPLDVDKARCLIRTRENSIRCVRSILSQKNETIEPPAQAGERSGQ